MKVLEYGTQTFDKLREYVAPLGEATDFRGRIDAAERFLKYEYKSHVTHVRVR